MKWTDEAEGAVSKVPFFIRKRVKKRVEEEAERARQSGGHSRPCQDLPAAVSKEHGRGGQGLPGGSLLRAYGLPQCGGRQSGPGSEA